MSKVNSENYWDSRFKEDWDENNGDKQSIFFMNLALQMLPEWLNQYFKKGNVTVCDWGCAEGDGTNVLAKAFPKCRFTGIDFAATAVESANKRYKNKNLSFKAADLLTTSSSERYDVVISSNVFEHFQDPWKTFETISEYARDIFIMMVPFKEDPENLIPEHFHSFNHDDFKLFGKKWDIAHFKVVDTSILPDTLWGGQQAVVVFVSKEFKKRHELTIGDIELSGDLRSRHDAKERDNLKVIEDLHSQIDDLQKSVQSLQAEHQVKHKKLVKVAPPGTLRRKTLAKAAKPIRRIRSAISKNRPPQT
jgi:hypothetical protein